MSVDPIFKTATPAWTPHAAPKGDMPRRTTDTVVALFPARSRPRNTRQTSSNSVHSLSRRSLGPSSLRNSISSTHKSSSSSEESPPHDSHSKGGDHIDTLPELPSPGAPKRPQLHSQISEPLLNNTTNSRHSSLNDIYASDAWRTQCQSEKRRNDQLRKALATERDTCRSQRDVIDCLRKELDQLKAVHAECRLHQYDNRSAVTDSTNSRKYRLQQRMQMFKEDLRGHRVMQRIRHHHRRGRSEEDGHRGKSGMPKRAFLSSTMG